MIVFLKNISNWKLLLPFLLLFVAINVFVLPGFEKKIFEITGENIKILDIRYSYTTLDVSTTLDKLGIEGRNFYRSITSKFDMVYPIIYSLFFFLLILAFIKHKITSNNSRPILFAFPPIVAAIFDYIENFNTLSLIDSYPAISTQTVHFGSQMTSLKWTFVGLSFLILFIAFVFWIVSTQVKKNS